MICVVRTLWPTCFAAWRFIFVPVNIPKTYSLLQVMSSIRAALEHNFRSQYWVMAEMNKLNHYHHSGHCYPELVEKSGKQVVAQSRAVIWKNDYERINQHFLETLKEPIKDGIKILFLCKVTFDPVHGLSLRIMDIDPSYTLGDLEKEKAESISTLKKEGLYDLNRNLRIALVPSRIAVISVESSKGFADFNRILDENNSGFRVSRTLFPSLLQGDGAVHGIMQQLKKIRKLADGFDAVAIIRGGGGDIGLTCYNNFGLAREVATFPLPVLTGIGHATNETVVEMVAHTNCITPTKVAEFLLDKYRIFNTAINELCAQLINLGRRTFREEQSLLAGEQRMLRSNAASILNASKKDLTSARSGTYHAAKYNMVRVKNSLDSSRTGIKVNSKELLAGSVRLLEAEERSISNLHPDKVLQRGYAVILHEGKIITGASGLKKGDEIEAVLKDGSVKGRVESFSGKPGIFNQQS